MNAETLILNRLDGIKSELDFIKNYLEDAILTKDDLESLEEAEKDLKKGKTKRI